MLGKLIKNEMRASACSVANIYFAALITAAIMAVGIFTGAVQIKLISSFALIVIACICIAVTAFSVITEFRKTMYGNVGYLSFTLPVKEHQLLFSKTFSAVVWVLISYLFFIASFVAVYFYFSGYAGAQLIFSFLKELEEYGMPSAATLSAFFFTLSAAGVFKIIYLVGVLFLSVTLSNIKPFQKLGTFGNVLMFFIILIIVSSISSRLGGLFDFSFVVKGSEMYFTTAEIHVMSGIEDGTLSLKVMPVIFNLFFGTVCFFINSYLMKTKINLK